MNPDRLHKMLVDIFGEEYEVRHGQFKINCINPNCDDSTGNLEISLDKRIFHCWKCNYRGSLKKLLQDYLGWSPDIDEYVSQDDLRKFYSKELFIEDKKVVKGFTGLPEDYIFLGSENLSMVGQKALKYALSRMTMDEVRKYRVGYCGLGKYKLRLVIPVFENGKAIYFITRAFMGGVIPVYDNPKKEDCGIGKNSVVFNIDGPLKTGFAVITEGVFDAIRVGPSGVAILGTVLSDEQLTKLLGVSEKFYILLDRDAIKKSLEIAKKILSNKKVEVNVVIPPAGDPADYSREEIDNWLILSKPFDLNVNISLRLTKDSWRKPKQNITSF